MSSSVATVTSGYLAWYSALKASTGTSMSFSARSLVCLRAWSGLSHKYCCRLLSWILSKYHPDVTCATSAFFFKKPRNFRIIS